MKKIAIKLLTALVCMAIADVIMHQVNMHDDIKHMVFFGAGSLYMAIAGYIDIKL